ncbi:hypothetical protein [Terricaulis sp.]|uniref:hypothetical protein n=1 Tax=Terricaulis sp. TaxID=2768686 RepID=UPI002AC424C9|nr:hypothetical protein [Terricaulis sp.]MDZ4690280.1 hypothetical protein [Terricaulis sp.]
MLHHRRMPLTFRRAEGARDFAGSQAGDQCRCVVAGAADRNVSSRTADVGAVEIEADAFS